MGVEIDQAGSGDQPFGIPHLRVAGVRRIAADRLHVPIREYDVGNTVDVLARIDDPPALQHQLLHARSPSDAMEKAP